MNVRAVKTGKGKHKLNISTINKRRASRENFELELSKFTEADKAKVSAEMVQDILKCKGRAYGIYQEKELVGIYIYERIEDFFVKVENKDSVKKVETRFKVNNIKEFFKMTDDDVMDFDDKLLGESKAIYRLVAKNFTDVAKEYKDEIEKYILADLKAQIEWGQIAGVLSEEKLVYRRHLGTNGKGSSLDDTGYGTGFVLGFALGLMLGWLVFDNITLGLLWGSCFALIGGLLSSSSAPKQEWATFDFVNKK